MAKVRIAADLPPRFSVRVEHDAAGERRVLQFGPHKIALADIVSADGDETRERHISGLFILAAGFLLVGMVSAFLVFEIGWRERYLIATVFLGILAVSGLIEMAKAKQLRFFEVRLATRSGDVVPFASADETEVRAFLDLLARAGVPLRSAA